MSETNGPTSVPRAAGHASYLRRLGYDDAAEAIEAADALVPGPDADRGAPAPEPQRPSDPEAARQAEGEAMMAALKRSIPDIYDR